METETYLSRTPFKSVSFKPTVRDGDRYSILASSTMFKVLSPP